MYFLGPPSFATHYEWLEYFRFVGQMIGKAVYEVLYP